MCVCGGGRRTHHGVECHPGLLPRGLPLEEALTEIGLRPCICQQILHVVHGSEVAWAGGDRSSGSHCSRGSGEDAPPGAHVSCPYSQVGATGHGNGQA